MSTGISLRVFLLLCPCLSVQAAQIYRCQQADGSISYQQQACSGTGEQVETGDAQTAWAGLRPGEKALYEGYRRRDRERLARRKAARKVARGKSSADVRVCFAKRQKLDDVNARLRRGYKAGQGEKLRRRRDNYEAYLRRFCP